MNILRWIIDETLLQNLFANFTTVLLIILIILCIIVLLKGADFMIDGVVGLAERTGLSKIVIGATIVSLGTTAPEAFVSVMAAWMGNPDLALGNGVGSIIADTGLIFGITCFLAPVPINRFILNRTGFVQVGAASLLFAISIFALFSNPAQPMLDRWVGFLFLTLLAAYMYATYFWHTQEKNLNTLKEEIYPKHVMRLDMCLIMVAGGLLLVVAAARILVPCASEIALRMGVPEDIVAATMIAFGTSLPELITAFSSVRKGHPEITLGNIVGADVLNCLFVIGAAAAAKPLIISTNFFIYHFPVMLFILYSFRFFIFSNKSDFFKKWQGIWLFATYVIYVLLQYAFNINTGCN